MAYQPDERAADFLLSEAAQPYLEQAAAFSLTPAYSLANLARLRSTLSPELAAAVLEQATLRQKAVSKFDRAAQMLFTADALQQASGQLPARHRARRFAGLRVADLTCGIGGDATAIAQVAAQTIATERDKVRLRFARHNLAAYGCAAHFIQSDALQPPFDISRVDAVFADPSRRGESRRVFNPSDYQPPLGSLYHLYGSRNLALKVAPGIDYAALGWPAEVEIVSVSGDVKEAVLWTGDLANNILANNIPLPAGGAGGGAESRNTHPLPTSPIGGGVGLLCRATLLPAGDTITNADAPDECAVAPAGRYLYEPDGAVIRAGLVRNLAALLGLWQLDPQIAYLSSDAPVSTPFARRFAVEQAAPFSLKSLTARLRELGVGIAEIKKRGLDIDPDALRLRLKLHGPDTRTVILTRVGSQPMMYICQLNIGRLQTVHTEGQRYFAAVMQVVFDQVPDNPATRYLVCVALAVLIVEGH